MNLEPRAFIVLLNEYLQDKSSGPIHCAQLLRSLNEALTKDEINSSDIEHYLIHFFDKNIGFVQFISSTLNNKSFKDVNKNILEILYTLINNFPLKLDKYVLQVHEICLKILKSSILSADEKVISLNVLILSFTKIDKCVELPEHYGEVYTSLQNSFAIKKCDSVQDKILTALGTFAQKFQYIVKNDNDLRNLFLNQLESEMIQKKPSFKVLSGTFLGLGNFCESFPFNPDSQEDTFIISKIYKHIERLSNATDRIKIANRAALTFLSSYLSLFINLMMKKYKQWHETLLKWLEMGPEEKKVGFSVLVSYYSELGNTLSKDVDKIHTDITLYLLDYFKKILKNSKVTNYEKRSVLCGLCSFATVYHLHLNPDDLKDLFILIMQTFEQSYILNQEFESSDTLEYLPNYIEAVAKMMHFNHFTNSELFCLQKGVINMIKTFPKLPYSAHVFVVDALTSTFHSLKQNDLKIFDNFVENTVYQGVVWSCSHQHVSEADISADNKEKVITVKNYLTLWKSLLKITPVRKYDKIKIFLQDRKYIVRCLVKNFVRTLLILINKLNVSIVPTESDGHITDPQAIYKVAEINDFAIFLNVVDFFEEIFAHIDPYELKKCIGKLNEHLISKCDKYPFISGFYKLLSFCLKISNKLQYFDESKVKSVQDVMICYESLTHFIQVLLDKTKQFKDDLLISCLQVLLECPPIIIKDILPLCVSAFTTIFQVGKSYTKLSNMALDTLERWQNELPNETLEPFLIQVTPILDSYLQSKSFGGVLQTNIQTRRKTAQALKKRKVLVEIEPELVRLQKRILNFIGQQNQAVCQAFVSADNNIELAVWGNQEHLKVVFPFEDLKLDIYLDNFVPRIVNMALNCSDRKTRVEACELLHAVVMVFLGTTKQLSKSGLTDLNELLKNMAFPLLKLGCDLDQVVQQLFQPLCFQLIHWYTHRSQIRGDHGAIIIEAMMEGIANPTDSALRDFSGKCVNEFIKWTIKQTSEATLARDPLNIKVLVKKMRFYSLHPDPFKKLGAALIFNNIYRELREESALLSMFWFEFLHIFVKSLSMIEYGADHDNCIQQINIALTHIQRGFTEKHALFNRNDSDRRVPTDIQGDILKDVSVWLLKQTGSRSPYCREKCKELFCAITPLTKGFKNFADFVTKHVSKDHDWVHENYETFLIQYPTVNVLPDADSGNLLKWMQALLCALDGNSFVVKNNLLSTSINLNKAMAVSIDYFVKNISQTSIQAALALISHKEWSFTVSQKQQFNKQKSQAAVKILHFLNSLLNNHKHTELVTGFCNYDLWNLILNMVFNPQSLGFEPLFSFKDDESFVLLLANFMKKISEDKLVELINVLTDYVDNSYFIEFDLNGQVPLKQRNTVKGLLLLQSCSVKQMNLCRFREGLIIELLTKFVQHEENGKIFATDLQDTTLNHCLSIVEFAFQDEKEIKSFVPCLFKPFKVESLETNRAVNLGYYILCLFEDFPIYRKIFEHFDIFVDTCVEKETHLEHSVELIFHLINYLNNQKDLRHQKGPISKILLNKWSSFENYFNRSLTTGIDFVKHLLSTTKIEKDKHSGLKTWLCGLLGHQSNLALNTEVFYLLVEVLGPQDNDNEVLRIGLDHLKNLFIMDNPLLPQETKVISLQKLLVTVTHIKTPHLLLFLLDAYIRVPQEIDFDNRTCLASYVSRNSEEVQKITLQEIYKMLLSCNYDCWQKYKLLKTIYPLFAYSSSSVFEQFFIENIAKMMQNWQEKSTQDNLIQKLINFALMEVLFMRSPINNSENDSSPITMAALGGAAKNKPFLLSCLKFTLAGCKDEPKIDSKFSDLLRLYKCFCYNAMVSIVTNSVKDLNLYTKLFVRQENGADILWKGLIDTSKKFVFESDFDTIPKKRKILVNIRDEIRAQKRREASQANSMRYLESQRVYNSSLSEDLTKFDFTNTVVRSQTEVREDQVVVDLQSEIELDSVDINNHECMATVCGLIEHLIKTGVTTFPNEDDDDGAAYVLPTWLEGIRNLLLDDETHDNVKIFWVKVIDNTAHIFRYFSKWFLNPLVKFIVNKCAGNSINYLVTDVIACLASWSAEVTPNDESEIELVSELVIFLINTISNERQDMFKYHLDLFKLIVEAWHSVIKIPYDLVYSKLNVDLTTRKVEIGIHLTSILLANKIAPWSDTNFKDYCMKLFDIIRKNNAKVTYRPCAETVGLLLRFVSNNENITKIVGNVQIVLKKIDCHEKYAYVLEGIVLHYPPIADEFHLTKLLSRIHGVVPSLKCVYMRIIISRFDFVDKVSDFKSEKWETYIEHNDLEVQLLSLELVYKCLEVLKGSPNFENIIKSVCKHVTHSDVLVRTRVYDIAISVCEKAKYDEYFYLCRDLLIQGLIDNDIEIREKVFQFWQNNRSLPASVSKRLAYILENLYKTSTESEFLGYSSYFLLEAIKKREEFTQELFEHPLEDCEFEDYNLQTDWRMRHLSVVPMFAETLRSFSDDLEPLSKSNYEQLRQTQNSFSFAPTQSVRMKQYSQYTMPESSLYIKTAENSFVDPNSVSISQRYKVPKRRFLKDKSKIQRFFANEEVKKSFKKVEQRKERASEQENKVKIYRSYRKGDLPDVQITLQSLLEPLQALSLHDGEISKTLYLSIFSAIISKTKDDDFILTISDAIKNIFNTSTQYNTNLFQALLDMTLLNKKSVTLDPGLITSVCLSSGLITTGSLLLEEYLISYDEVPSSSKKSHTMMDSEGEMTYWVKLAELNREIEEWDIVKSIFLQKLDCHEDAKIALVAESQKNWSEAKTNYEKLIETDDSTDKKDFYFESCFKCLAFMGKWYAADESSASSKEDVLTQLEKVLNSTSPWPELWDQSWNQQKLLPWYMKAQLIKTFSNKNSQDFFVNLNNLNSVNYEYLQNHFSEELCMLWLHQEELETAKQYVNININNFLENWQLINPLYLNLRYNNLLKLRNIIDVNKFLQTYEDVHEDSRKNLQDLIRYWDKTNNENLPSILLTEIRVLARRQFINLLIKKIQGFEDEDMTDFIEELKSIEFKLNIGFIDSAIDQNNFYVARNGMQVLRGTSKAQIQLSLSKIAHLRCLSIPSSPLDNLNVMMQASKSLGTLLKNDQNVNLQLAAHIQLFNNLKLIHEIVEDDGPLLDRIKLDKDFLSLTGDKICDSSVDLPNFAAEKLKLFIHRRENDASEPMQLETQTDVSKDTKIIADAYVKLAYFSKEQEGQFSNFIFAILRAMKYGSSEARQLFPCILMEANFTEPQLNMFLEESEQIPVWMFLGWIPQLLVHVDSPKVKVVAPIILRIARTYPQSIMYAYRLSKENYTFTDEAVRSSSLEVIKELDLILLSDSRVDMFLKALSFVSVSISALFYYVRKIFKLCHTAADNRERINCAIEDAVTHLFDHTPDSRNINAMQGSMFKKIDKYNKTFKALSGKSVENIVKGLKTIDAELSGMLKARNEKHSSLLKDYSPWLANFSADKLNIDLEIPGQYDGRRMPLTQHHVKILGFSPDVVVMHSLRKPIKIVILGNDTKEYPYLIKFGEDIRQDQRIEQLFSLMNNIFENDKTFNRKDLSILTFQVVPLTTNLGMIQWIDDTAPLQQFIKKPIKDVKSVQFEKPSETYQNWIYKSSRPKTDKEAYGNAAVKYTRDQTIAKYRSLVHMLPWDVLRTSLWNLSANTQGFYALRSNFIKSYAVLCTAQWLLGIGDRHLENSLICLKNGRVSGIDFGHAFGTATQILPVPELVPIRLTPHIVNLMEPLGEKGLFREIMIHCLRSLRTNAPSLLATMNVFIEEPSIDWLEHASKFEEGSDPNSHNWYPAKKIEQARRKLGGVSSASIMVEDLRAGHSDQENYMNAYIRLVEGVVEIDLRAQKGSDHLSVEDQVDSLIDHATDYNLLGRMFVGWMPWV